MALDFRDAYLRDFCDYDAEQAARADVALLDPDSNFTSAWTDKLAVVKTYINVCLENQAQEDDLFAIKLKQYNREFDGLLAQARTAAVDADGNYAPIYSIPLERA